MEGSNIYNIGIISKVFDKYTDLLVNIADAWDAHNDIEELDNDLQSFAEMAAFEVEMQLGEIEYQPYIDLMGELGQYAGKWINLFLNRASWNHQPDWLGNHVRKALENQIKRINN